MFCHRYFASLGLLLRTSLNLDGSTAVNNHIIKRYHKNVWCRVNNAGVKMSAAFSLPSYAMPAALHIKSMADTFLAYAGTSCKALGNHTGVQAQRIVTSLHGHVPNTRAC